MNTTGDSPPQRQTLFECFRAPITFIILVFIMSMFLSLSTNQYGYGSNVLQPSVASYESSNKVVPLVQKSNNTRIKINQEKGGKENNNREMKSNAVTQDILQRKKEVPKTSSSQKNKNIILTTIRNNSARNKSLDNTNSSSTRQKIESDEKNFINVSVARFNRTYFVCPNWAGRIGNLMFEYASLYGIAKEHGMRLAITPSDYVYRTFNLTIQTITDAKRNEICRTAKVRRYPVPGYFHNISIPKNAHVKIIGHLQSWKYFRNYEKEIRTQYVFKKKVQDAAKIVRDGVINKFKLNGYSDVITIGVHIRRGDYVTEKRINAGPDFLQKARDYYRQRYKNAVFLVCTNPDSNSRNWVSVNFVNGNKDTILMRPQPGEVDILFLSQCDHLIITVGSFGWWAAWLNNGTTVYYDFLDLDKKRFNTADHIYPGWIGIK